MCINIVYAEEPDVDLLDLPRVLGETLGISTLSAGLILSILLVLPFDLCLITWSKSGKIAIILNLVFLTFFTSIGWIPNWSILIVILILAGLYAGKTKGVF